MREQTRLERTSQVVRGERSELRVDDGTLTLTKDATTQARPTNVTVPIDRVRAVTLQRPGPGRRGWLHLSVVDGTPAPVSELAAASDPYTLPLRSRHLGAARRLTRAITDHVRRRGLPHVGDVPAQASSGVVLTTAEPSPATDAGHIPPTPPPPPPPAPQPAVQEEVAPREPEETAPREPEDDAPEGDLIAKLRDLADLHRQGALTDEEFQQAKQQILGD